jgi:hypothetical protein
MSNEKKQSAVEWFANMTSKLGYVSADILNKAKEIEREQIAEAFTKGNRLDVYDGTETSGEKYYKGLYECQFEMNTSTSSATKCKFCGQEKWKHISGRI